MKQRSLLFRSMVVASVAFLPFLIFSCQKKKTYNCESFNPAATKYLVYTVGDSVFFLSDSNDKAVLVFSNEQYSTAGPANCHGKYGGDCDQCNISASRSGYLTVYYDTDSSTTFDGVDIRVGEDSDEGKPTGKYTVTLTPFPVSVIRFQVEPNIKLEYGANDSDVVFKPSVTLNQKSLTNVYEIRYDSSVYNQYLTRLYYNFETGVEAFEFNNPKRIFVKQ